MLADADRPGGYLLIVDRVRQSYVDLDDPTYLDFEYLQTMADVLDALSPAPPGPAGGHPRRRRARCTLARYVAATRPGSSQVVLEPDEALIELVRARLPLPARSGIRIRPVDGATGHARRCRPAGADVVVLDAFLGGRVPAELTAPRVPRPRSPGCCARAACCWPTSPDGPPLTYLRRVLATLRRAVRRTLLVVADAAVLRGRRFGNLVVVGVAGAAARGRRSPGAAAAAAFPRRVRGGRELDAFDRRARARSPRPISPARRRRRSTPGGSSSELHSRGREAHGRLDRMAGDSSC